VAEEEDSSSFRFSFADVPSGPEVDPIDIKGAIRGVFSGLEGRLIELSNSKKVPRQKYYGIEEAEIRVRNIREDIHKNFLVTLHQELARLEMVVEQTKEQMKLLSPQKLGAYGKRYDELSGQDAHDLEEGFAYVEEELDIYTYSLTDIIRETSNFQLNSNLHSFQFLELEQAKKKGDKVGIENAKHKLNKAGRQLMKMGIITKMDLTDFRSSFQHLPLGTFKKIKWIGGQESSSTGIMSFAYFLTRLYDKGIVKASKKWLVPSSLVRNQKGFQYSESSMRKMASKVKNQRSASFDMIDKVVETLSR
jgi:hypothetical protein